MTDQVSDSGLPVPLTGDSHPSRQPGQAARSGPLAPLREMLRRASESSFFKLLELGGKCTVLVGVIFYFAEAPRRELDSQRKAWQVIQLAHGTGGDGGRSQALNALAKDGVSLAGVTVASAGDATPVLQSLELPGADLRKANFTGTEFIDLSLAGANLDEATFAHANLRGARLQHASLVGAMFFKADLSFADLTGADLTGAKLTSATLTGTRFHGATMSQSDLRWASLDGADLTEAELDHAHLLDAELSGADLTSANLFGADLTGAKLCDATLAKTYLLDAQLRKLDLGAWPIEFMRIKLKEAEHWQDAQYDDDVRLGLGLELAQPAGYEPAPKDAKE